MKLLRIFLGRDTPRFDDLLVRCNGTILVCYCIGGYGQKTNEMLQKWLVSLSQNALRSENNYLPREGVIHPPK